MNLKPMGDRIVVKESEPDKMTASGLLIPDAKGDKNECKIGHIVAIGTGVKYNLNVGQKIAWKRYGGQGVLLESNGMPEEVLVIREDEMLGVFQ